MVRAESVHRSMNHESDRSNDDDGDDDLVFWKTGRFSWKLASITEFRQSKFFTRYKNYDGLKKPRMIQKILVVSPMIWRESNTFSWFVA